MDIPDYIEKYGEPETLEQILNYCAFLMRQCRLEHRTLHHFNWFVSSLIFGKTEYDRAVKYAESEKPKTDEGKFALDILMGSAKDGLEIYEKYNYIYDNEGNPWLKYAKAFKQYCEDEYGDDDGL